MATVCQSSPTLTRTDVTTTGYSSVITSLVRSTSTEDDITSTIVTTICPTGVSASCVPSTTTTVIQGTGAVVVTRTVEVTAFIDTVVTNTVTLYSQACSVGNRPVSPPIVSPTPAPPISVPGASRPITTPVVVTISGSRTTILPLSTALDSSGSNSNSSSKKVPVGAIAGGVVGGLVLFAAVGFFAYKFIAKKMALKRLNNHFDEDDDIDAKPDIYAADSTSQNPLPPVHSQEHSNTTAHGGQGQYYQGQSPEMQQYPLGQPQSPEQTGQPIPAQQGYQYQFSPDVSLQTQNNRPTSGQYAPPVPTGSPPAQAPYMNPTAGYSHQQQQNYAPATAPSSPPTHGLVYDPNLGYAPPPPMTQYATGYNGYAEPSRGLSP